MRIRMKKRMTASIALILITAFLLTSVAGAAAKKLIVRVSYPKTLTVYVGGSASMNVKLTPNVAGLQVKYTSRSTKIATVSEAGVVTGLRKGTTTITTTVGKKGFRTTVRVLKAKASASVGQVNPALPPVPLVPLVPLPAAAAPAIIPMSVPGSFISVGSELDIINKYRADSGVSPLTINNNVMASAQIRAYEASISFSHTRPNGSSGLELIRIAEPSSRYAGENLAMAQGASGTDPQYIMSLWMNSPGHRANILRADYTQVAIAAYLAPNGAVYWTQLFLSQ